MRMNVMATMGLLLIWTSTAFGQSATIYDLKDTEKKLFNFDKKTSTEADLQVVKSTFSNLDGKAVVVDVAKFKGGKLVEFQHEQKQLNAKGSVIVKDGKVNFSYTVNGKTKTDDEKHVDNFVIAPMIVPFIMKNWSSIVKGDSVKMRLGVLDRLDTVGFKVFKEKDTTYNKQPAIEVTMKPSSFIIAALVDPLKLTFTKDGSKILTFKGRSAPKLNVDGKFKDLDALTVYNY